MKALRLGWVVFGIFLSLSFISTVQSAEKTKEPSAEMQAMMAKVKEAGTPGPEHEVLKALEGNWTATSRQWMKPGEKPQHSTGTSSMTWVMGGRFLEQKYQGDWMGQPFEGLGIIGYDKVKKEYVSVWLDNMSTGIFQGAGLFDAATNAIAESGTVSCPITGKKDMWYRSEWKILNDNKNIFSMYIKDPAGKEFKSMEIVYQRVK